MKVLELIIKLKFTPTEEGEDSYTQVMGDPEVTKEIPCDPEEKIVKIANEIADENNSHIEMAKMIMFQERDPEKVYHVMQKRLVE